MSSKKQKLIAVALGMISTQSGGHADTPKKGEKVVECFGINACAGQNGCAVNQEQIDKARVVYKNQFSKSSPISCAGLTECAGKGKKGGHLAWMPKKNTKECFHTGGFVFEKNDKGELIIRDKDGIK